MDTVCSDSDETKGARSDLDIGASSSWPCIVKVQFCTIRHQKLDERDRRKSPGSNARSNVAGDPSWSTRDNVEMWQRCEIEVRRL